jgi:hypothetical protein
VHVACSLSSLLHVENPGTDMKLRSIDCLVNNSLVATSVPVVVVPTILGAGPRVSMSMH